jgi:hypothetical protein
MPVFDNATVLDPLRVEDQEARGLARTPGVAELRRDFSRELVAGVEVRSGAVAGDDRIVDFSAYSARDWFSHLLKIVGFLIN